jgi:hypothetical protein
LLISVLPPSDLFREGAEVSQNRQAIKWRRNESPEPPPFRKAAQAPARPSQLGPFRRIAHFLQFQTTQTSTSEGANKDWNSRSWKAKFQFPVVGSLVLNLGRRNGTSRDFRRKSGCEPLDRRMTRPSNVCNSRQCGEFRGLQNLRNGVRLEPSKPDAAVRFDCKPASDSVPSISGMRRG